MASEDVRWGYCDWISSMLSKIIRPLPGIIRQGINKIPNWQNGDPDVRGSDCCSVLLSATFMKLKTLASGFLLHVLLGGVGDGAAIEWLLDLGGFLMAMHLHLHLRGWWQTTFAMLIPSQC